MADGTKIEWTDATWNPITGCSLSSPGCTHCYAMKLAGGRMTNHPSRAGLTRPSKAGPVWTGEVRFNEGWLHQPLTWSKPREIFVCAHGDLFHENVPDAWIDRVFAIMALAQQHRFQVLTKRSARMRAYMIDPETPGRIHKALMDWGSSARDAGRRAKAAWTLEAWPISNVWLGVSVEDQSRADERIPDLLATPAAVRWISAEPLLGPVDLRGYIRGARDRRAWSTWSWPSWVPERTRAHIEEFWRAEYGRGVDSWIRGAVNNGQPPLGTIGSYSLGGNIARAVTGRFVPCWNNIGVAVDAEGAAHTVAEGVYQGRPPYIDWVVAGGESGPGARPMNKDWARALRDQCSSAGVPFLFKQWGDWFPYGAIDADGDHNSRDRGEDPRHWHTWGEGQGFSVRIGKAQAGRFLDGVQHDGMPA